jgi:homoserine kinase
VSRLFTVTAFAPATVANVAVGFDIMGFPVDAVGDEVTVTRIDKPEVRVKAVTGISGEIPLDPARNTATIGLIEMISDYSLGFGFEVSIRKCIPLGSGMGGSAASAVGALVAANALLESPLPRERLLKYALLGEYVASGAAHPDNAAPCLFGGLTLTRSVDPVEVVRIPVPESIRCVLVHPHARLDTRTARGVLRREVPLVDHVRQSTNLAGFLAGCFSGDIALIGRSMVDVLVEPQRAPLINGFVKAKEAAMRAGALGCSISGSGPSVFAWVGSTHEATVVMNAMTRAFAEVGVESDAWVSPVSSEGARII